MTRREFIAGATSFVGGVSAFGKPIRSALGSRVPMSAESAKHTASDYVQDGLIALWDGIENVDWNKPDVASTTWNDLVGGRKATLNYHGFFSGYSLVCDGVGYAAKDGAMFSRSVVRAVEIVFSSESTGIIATIANKSSSSGDSGIRIVMVEGGELGCMVANSSFAGLKNRIAFSSDGVSSVSLVYDDTDFLGGFINGTWTNSFYRFLGHAMSNITFGGRAENSDVPWAGQIFSIRVYDRQLSERDVLQNLQIDNWRFGI